MFLQGGRTHGTVMPIGRGEDFASWEAPAWEDTATFHTPVGSGHA